MIHINQLHYRHVLIAINRIKNRVLLHHKAHVVRDEYIWCEWDEKKKRKCERFYIHACLIWLKGLPNRLVYAAASHSLIHRLIASLIDNACFAVWSFAHPRSLYCIDGKCSTNSSTRTSIANGNTTRWIGILTIRCSTIIRTINYYITT